MDVKNTEDNNNSIKVHKVVKTKLIRKRYYKTLGTSEINRPLSPLYLGY